MHVVVVCMYVVYVGVGVCSVHRYVTASVTSHLHSIYIHASCTYSPMQQC